MNFGGTIKINKSKLLIILFIFMFIIFYMNKYTFSNEPNVNKISLHKLLIASIEAAKLGGVEILDVSKSDYSIYSKGKTKEGLEDSVTNADYRSHCVMYNSIKHLFPNIKIVSEEHKKDCAENEPLVLTGDDLPDSVHPINEVFVDAKDVNVWIDPLDATKEFTEHLHQYVTTMVCVAVSGRPVIGVIHKPFEKITSWAWVNNTYSKDLLKNKNRKLDNNGGIIISRSHAGEASQRLTKAFGVDTKIINAAGSGYKVLEVVSQNVSAYIHTTAIKKWDICAGDAVLTALNGRMTTLSNKLIDYSDTQNPINSDGLLATLHNHDWFLNKLNNNT